MEFIKKEKIVELSNPGVISRQLLNPDNSSSKRITITEVHLESGACQKRHTHNLSEQVWYATKGFGKILLANNKEIEFRSGDVVRFDSDTWAIKCWRQRICLYICNSTTDSLWLCLQQKVII